VTEAGPYEIALSWEARRDLHRLPTKVAAAVVEFITVPLVGQPARLSKPLGADLAGLRSARRGDYRVFFSIDEATHAVLVVRIDQRCQIYRPR
jgi:mRNA-degrading endonuclease RelE of RelBE toxin-antitoxin system